MPEVIIKKAPVYNMGVLKPTVIKLKVGLDKLLKLGYIEYISFQYSENVLFSYVNIKGNDITIIGQGKTYNESIDNLNQQIINMNLEL